MKRKPNLNTIQFGLALLVAIGTSFPNIYYSFYINGYMHENREKAPYTNYTVVSLADCQKVLIGAIVCQIVKKIVTSGSYPLFDAIAKNKTDPKMREMYAKKAALNLYKIIYFSLSALWGWSVLNRSGYLWSGLGGTLHSKDLISVVLQVPFEEQIPGLLDYSLYTFGYHFGDFIAHSFFAEKMNDWEEMQVHHITTVMLYFGYITGNQLVIGSFIAYLHDLADILGAAVKLLNATTF